jgi:hypothetical protein
MGAFEWLYDSTATGGTPGLSQIITGTLFLACDISCADGFPARYDLTQEELAKKVGVRRNNPFFGKRKI